MKTEKWIQDWGKGFDEKKRCSRCLYDEDTASITFDENGVCNYCHQWDELNKQHPTGDEGWELLERKADEIRKAGQGKKYDVIVGVSGGCDSSYLLYIAKQLKLRPLAVHYDNTWNSDVAVSNIRNVLDALDTELYTYVVDNEEMDDMFKAFFKSGTVELECPTDIGLASTLYIGAMKHNVQYIFEGHSFRTEGLSPLGWMYMDGKYIQDVVKQYGTKKIKSFPNLTFLFQLRCMLLSKIKRVRPLWYIDHVKEETKQFLADEFGWEWYGGHHLENRMTAFFHTYWLPRGFNMDHRTNGYAALIRSGQMTREEGLEKLKAPPKVDFELVDLFKKRLGLSDAEFEKYMDQPKRTYKDFKTYKPLFIKLRPFFKVMADLDLVPRSFYLKYTSKDT